MKRIFIILLALSLLFALCACGGDTPTEPSTEPSEVPTTEQTEPPTTEQTEPPTTEQTEPPVLYRNPLNGEPMDEPYNGRPVAIVINNQVHALPQYGISEADLMYELEVEGDITRYMAIFSDLSDVGTIGPVRSARVFFNNIALSFDAPMVHCGGSEFALKGHVDETGTKISNWQHINEAYNGSYFFRDYERYNSGYSWEHTLFTSGSQMMEAMVDKEYTKHTDTFLEQQTSELNYGLQFADEVDLNGETANQVTAVFRLGKTTGFTYDPETGLYNASQYKQEHMDAAAGKCVAYRNVLVLYTTKWGKADSSYVRSFYDLLGEGTGYFACDGQIVPIRWYRDSYRSSFTYTLEDGTPLTLGVGSTYVGISAAETYVTYE